MDKGKSHLRYIQGAATAGMGKVWPLGQIFSLPPLVKHLSQDHLNSIFNPKFPLINISAGQNGALLQVGLF